MTHSIISLGKAFPLDSLQRAAVSPVGSVGASKCLQHFEVATGDPHPFGTRLCLQSLVCYTLVPADAEKGLREAPASTCSVAEGCADGHFLPTQRRLAEEPMVYVLPSCRSSAPRPVLVALFVVSSKNISCKGYASHSFCSIIFS